MNPHCTRMYTHPCFEATPPGAAPGPPVNTGAHVRHFRGCKGVASKNGWVYMRVQGGFISYSYFVCLSVCTKVAV